MRILIFTQYFRPEIGATQTRLHGFAAELASRGHEVEVICAVPNHPQGVIHPGFRRRARVRLELDGFAVTHVWVYTRPVKSAASRLAYYASYGAMASVAGTLRRRPDVILASSPPLPVAAAGDAVARLRRVPWVMDVRDLWPAAAVAMGELGPGRGLAALEQLERRLYGSADAITVVTVPFRNRVAALTELEKITIVPNGTTPFWLGGADSPSDRRELELSADEFVWTFAGNVGGAQGLESAIKAAALLGSGYRLLVLGDGPARPALESLSGGLRGNVEFRGQVSEGTARRYLQASDALLVPLAPDPILEDFVPSKLFDFCATGVPVICSAAGEPTRLVRAHGAALTVEPGQAEALADAVRRLRGSEDLRRSLGQAGREFATRNLRTAHTDLLEHVLLSAASGDAPTKR